MVRYKVMVSIDVMDDDQTDEEAIVDVVKYWISRGIAEDFRVTSVHWPPTGPPPGNDPNLNWEVTIPHTWKAVRIRKEGMDE